MATETECMPICKFIFVFHHSKHDEFGPTKHILTMTMQERFISVFRKVNSQNGMANFKLQEPVS